MTPAIKPRPTARLLPFDPQGRLLLVHMHDENVANADGEVLSDPYWVTVGGAIDAGETPLEAAWRELEEETGLNRDTARIGPPVWYAEHVLTFYGRRSLLQDTFFLAEGFPTELDHSGFETTEKAAISHMKWWPVDDLLASSQQVFPRGLKAELPAMLANGPPSGIRTIRA